MIVSPKLVVSRAIVSLLILACFHVPGSAQEEREEISTPFLGGGTLPLLGNSATKELRRYLCDLDSAGPELLRELGDTQALGDTLLQVAGALGVQEAVGAGSFRAVGTDVRPTVYRMPSPAEPLSQADSVTRHRARGWQKIENR